MLQSQINRTYDSELNLSDMDIELLNTPLKVILAHPDRDQLLFQALRAKEIISDYNHRQPRVVLKSLNFGGETGSTGSSSDPGREGQCFPTSTKEQ